MIFNLTNFNVNLVKYNNLNNKKLISKKYKKCIK